MCFFVGIVCNFHMFVCFLTTGIFFSFGVWCGVILHPTRPCFSIKAKGVGLDTCVIAFGMKFAWGNESDVESTLKCVERVAKGGEYLLSLLSYPGVSANADPHT